jgi:hypothetical protein
MLEQLRFELRGSSGAAGSPYALCAALWLPWSSRTTHLIAGNFALVLFLVTVAIYLPTLAESGRYLGDMYWLWAMLYAVIGCGVVLFVSVLALLFARPWEHNPPDDRSSPKG